MTVIATRIAAAGVAALLLAACQHASVPPAPVAASRLWKNCDNYELNDRFVSVPSARLAAREALVRCGGCSILYLNDRRQR